jgi:hypothetical protein
LALFEIIPDRNSWYSDDREIPYRSGALRVVAVVIKCVGYFLSRPSSHLYYCIFMMNLNTILWSTPISTSYCFYTRLFSQNFICISFFPFILYNWFIGTLLVCVSWQHYAEGTNYEVSRFGVCFLSCAFTPENGRPQGYVLPGWSYRPPLTPVLSILLSQKFLSMYSDRRFLWLLKWGISITEELPIVDFLQETDRKLNCVNETRNVHFTQCSLCSSLNVRDQVSHPYRTTDNIPCYFIIQIILSFNVKKQGYNLNSIHKLWPPLRSSVQSSCLQIRRPGFDSRHYQKKVVGLERGPLSLVNTTEELLDRKVAAPV